MAIPLGPFDLVEPLGSGGMGAVWRAIHREQSIPAAVKVVSNTGGEEFDFREEFEREVQAVAGLAHPGIVSVYDYGVIPERAARASQGRLVAGSPMLAMELAEGGSLTNLHQISSWAELRDLLLQVLDALGYAHARGMIHRDVKPTNILLSSTRNGRIRYKLTDFGIAHAVDPYASPATQKNGLYRGSPDYSPPEQIEGRWRDFGPWTDLYALGCVAYEFVSGRPPFLADNFVQLAVCHLDEPPPPIEPRFELPAGFEAWLMRLLEKTPRSRFERAADAAWALMQLAPAGDPASSAPARALAEPAAADGRPSIQVGPATDEFELGGQRSTVDESIEEVPTIEMTRAPTTPSARGLSLPERAWAQSEAFDGDGGMLQERPPQWDLPPIPPSWRRETPRKPATHLIGAGLNLFGLREVEFIGREAERDVIWGQLLEVAETRQARAVVIRGASGTGKSRLAQWIGQRAHEIGAAEVLAASHDAQTSPMESLRRMLEQPLSTWGQAPDQVHQRVCEMLEPLFALDASQEEAFLLDYTARALTEYVRPQASGSHALDGPAVDSRSKRERYAVISRFLQALTTKRPALLWLDDVPWSADALGLVEYLLESNEPLPVLMVLTARDEDLAQRPAIDERLEALAHLDQAAAIDLGPLPAPNHTELIEHLLTLSPQLAWQVEQRTAGNPLFAVQLVRDWVERDVLEASPRGFVLREGADAPLPDDLTALCRERVDRFVQRHYPTRGEEVRQVLEVAAALGREIDLVEWRTACKNLGLQMPEDLVAEMVTNKLARRDPHGWSFVHGALREVIERTARKAGRWEYHQHNCIMMLDELYGLESPGVWRRWADHLIRAGELEEALEPLLAAANEARQTDDCPTGLEVLDRVETICEQLELGADVRRVRAWLQRAYLLRQYRHAHDRQAAGELVERATRMARDNGWLRELGLALLEEARTMAHDGHFDEALVSYESARSIFEENVMAEEAVSTLLNMSVAQRRTGKFNQMLRTLREARRICPAHDERHRALIHERYTQYYLDGPQKDLEQAQFHARRFLRAARRHLSPVSEAKAWCNLGEIRRLEGRHDEALDDYRRAYSLSSGVGAVRLPCICLHNIGMVEFERGHIADAHQRFRDSRVCMEKNDYRLWLAVPILGVAACEAMDGHLESARSLFEAATRRLEERNHFVRDLAILALGLGRAAAKAGWADLARPALELAGEHWAVEDPERVAECEALLDEL